MVAKYIYLIGALANPKVQDVERELRDAGHYPFASWFAAGPDADQHLWRYERSQGRSYKEALNGYAAKNIFNFDKTHIDRCGVGVLVAPAGKSGHLELGYMIGQGKPAFILFPDGAPERMDVMFQFATDVCFSVTELLTALQNIGKDKPQALYEAYRGTWGAQLQNTNCRVCHPPNNLPGNVNWVSGKEIQKHYDNCPKPVPPIMERV